jgi:3-deoxy-D-manno-octulosonate 8-phosphate phosphatase KdsC-like HAD superfamily phosphatase
VGLPIAVANACPEVRAAARVVTDAEGGRGAAREAAELILSARGEWDGLVQRYLAEREREDDDAVARAAKAR